MRVEKREYARGNSRSARRQRVKFLRTKISKVPTKVILLELLSILCLYIPNRCSDGMA